MKGKLKNIKQVNWSKVGWIAAGMVVAYFSIAAISYKSSLKLREIYIHVGNANGLLFIDSTDVQQMLADMGIKKGRNVLASIDCNKIERGLEQNPYTGNVEAFVDALGSLHIEAEQRVALIRIINSNAVSFYLDESGRKMPLSPKFTARVVVAGGNIRAGESVTDTLGKGMLKQIFTIADLVSTDTFLTRMIDQVWVDEKNEFHLIPKVAGQEVFLGSIDGLKEKMSKLKSFYAVTFNTNCSDYRFINLEYKNEVVATRKDAAPPAMMKQETTVTTDTLKKQNSL